VPLVLVALAWVLSHLHYDFDSAGGRALLLVTYGGENPGERRHTLESDWDFWTSDPEFSWSRLGLELHRGTGYVSASGRDGWERWDYGYTVVAVPYWAPMLLGSLPAAAWVARAVRRRGRERHNRCGHCGYDLRAATNRCPECGQSIRGKGIPPVSGDAK
jgi:hypothetical protein